MYCQDNNFHGEISIFGNNETDSCNKTFFFEMERWYGKRWIVIAVKTIWDQITIRLKWLSVFKVQQNTFYWQKSWGFPLPRNWQVIAQKYETRVTDYGNNKTKFTFSWGCPAAGWYSLKINSIFLFYFSWPILDINWKRR